ncbi:Rieske (2Fe-2S) protein [Rhizocola hellebori]|nr:Rieske (2Fe-2S) protein [Rhizocola hellebori]
MSDEGEAFGGTVRRTLLARGGVLCGAVGLTGLTAACGGGAATSSTGSGTESGGSGVVGDVLAAVGQVPIGGGVVVSGVLVVQPTAGVFKAYSATCPHQGGQVSAPVDGVATCRLHQSTFDIGDGARLGGPATRGLTAIGATVQGSNVVRS